MLKILVAGLINIETTLKVDAFPVTYQPVRVPFFGVNTTVSGVGYNVTKALSALGHAVAFLSLTGKDYAGELVEQSLHFLPARDRRVLRQMDATAQSVIIFEPGGTRMIFTDLKDIQDQVYPMAASRAALVGCDLAVICNINFARPMLAIAREVGVPIATDVHTIASLDDAYNQDFMAAADILFMSDEHVPASPPDFARSLYERYKNRVIVIGMGKAGALLHLGETGEQVHVPAVYTRPVVNTIGAGDALFSSFVHGIVSGQDPAQALRAAVVFASFKIGANGGAEGFLDADGLAEWVGRASPLENP